MRILGTWSTIQAKKSHTTKSHRGTSENNAKSSLPSWSDSANKRCFDLLASSCALVALFPLFLLTALAVRLSSRGPVFFRQVRMGKHGQTFRIFKFRTMRIGLANAGPSVTKVGDKRLTSVGSFLRRSKLDELPQLINVLLGDMSLVGPRPKVPHHQRVALDFRPGITGAASIAFRNEEAALKRIPDEHLDFYQVNVMMPVKNDLDNRYMVSATLWTDLHLMAKTVMGGGTEEGVSEIFTTQQSLLLLNRALTNSHSESQGHASVSTSFHLSTAPEAEPVFQFQ